MAGLRLRTRIGDIPKAAVVPVLEILPIGTIQNGIKADASDRNASVAGVGDFCGYFGNPFTASTADMTGLRNQQRAPVALVNLMQQRAKR
ncbi:conserved hypothetical protein [Ricinus communis]|uniref:Uncharacterized protein n=1 Tax=Ricinus communis TaxID=3988 RepID=B9TMM4_RICCO|nr:conserved hypothetical protein [Ricinus communis]